MTKVRRLKAVHLSSLILFSMLLLQGCSPKLFKPEEYQLDPTAVSAFPVSGTAVIVNDQPSTDKVTVYRSGPTWYSDRHALTEAMVQQATEELKKHGQFTQGSSGNKTIGLKVDTLVSDYKNFTFHWASSMDFEVMLGDGQKFDIKVEHGTGWSEDQDLNGCIADSVAALLNDERVRAYLAR